MTYISKLHEDETISIVYLKFNQKVNTIHYIIISFMLCSHASVDKTMAFFEKANKSKVGLCN